jgi:hypothetical protein
VVDTSRVIDTQKSQLGEIEVSGSQDSKHMSGKHGPDVPEPVPRWLGDSPEKESKLCSVDGQQSVVDADAKQPSQDSPDNAVENRPAVDLTLHPPPLPTSHPPSLPPSPPPVFPIKFFLPTHPTSFSAKKLLLAISTHSLPPDTREYSNVHLQITTRDQNYFTSILDPPLTPQIFLGLLPDDFITIKIFDNDFRLTKAIFAKQLPN